MGKKAHTTNNCPGCGTPLKNAGAPIGDDYCPNDDCRHRAEEIKRQISVATKAHRRDKQIRDAAPDLLEALTEARTAIDYAKRGTTDPEDERLFKGTLGRIDAAISKATGGQ